jgi:hypothetical protein
MAELNAKIKEAEENLRKWEAEVQDEEALLKE